MDRLHHYEAQNTRERWSYPTFSRFMLRLADKGFSGLEHLNRYPKEIELHPFWHQTLNNIRQATKDGRERWALVGHRPGENDVLLPDFPAIGHYDHIPWEAAEFEIYKARNKFKIDKILGDIHSHPDDFIENTSRHIISFLQPQVLHVHFSIADLYCLLVPSSLNQFMVLVEGDYNLLAVRSLETSLFQETNHVNLNSFKKYWYHKSGFEFSPDSNIGSIYPIPFKANFDETNLRIVQAHNIALYQGKKNQSLTRVYPY